MKRLLSSSSTIVAAVASNSISIISSSRSISQSSPAGSNDATNDWVSYWNAPGKRNRHPSRWANTPAGSQKVGKTHIEWKFHHGAGGRIGRYDSTRYVPDFEHVDGTPAPTTKTRHSLMAFHDRQLYEMITAGAVVEGLAADGRLPRIPGVKEQRDWDPEIPLFLSDADEHGIAPSLAHAGNTTEAHREAMFGGASTHKRDPVARRVNAKYTSEQDAMEGKTIIKNPSTEGSTLTPITMFASYSPAGMFTEPLVTRTRRVTPFDRRRWNLTDQFLVSKGPKPRNTIADGGAKIQ